MTQITALARHASFGGVQGFYQHASSTIGLPMKFGVYVPPSALQQPAPVLFYLAGLTCNEETLAHKGGAQRWAAEHGVLLVTPDTSPRGTGIELADKDWDLGTAASFYLDAHEPPWQQHWRMFSYLSTELPDLIAQHFPADTRRLGIFGHSMGGHGALVLALRAPQIFRSVSAFAPICAPMQCPWGQKAFKAYLGDNTTLWEGHDACALLLGGARAPHLLIDQGLQDPFLAEQLGTDVLERVCQQVGQPLTLRRHAADDHSYYFVSTWMADHVQHHANSLRNLAL